MFTIRVSLYGWRCCWAKPSDPYLEWQGVRISGVLIVCKSMEIVFWTEQSVRIIVDASISVASVRQGSSVYYLIVVPLCSFSEHMQLFHPEHAEEILKSLGHEGVAAGAGGGAVGRAIGGGG